MVNVSNKEPLRRTAIAQGEVLVAPETLRLVRENALKKGDALSCARIAGTQVATVHGPYAESEKNHTPLSSA